MVCYSRLAKVDRWFYSGLTRWTESDGMVDRVDEKDLPELRAESEVGAVPYFKQKKGKGVRKPKTSPTHHPNPALFPAHQINCPNLNPTHIAHSQPWEPTSADVSRNLNKHALTGPPSLQFQKGTHSPVLVGISLILTLFSLKSPFSFPLQALTYLESSTWPAQFPFLFLTRCPATIMILIFPPLFYIFLLSMNSLPISL